VTAAQVVGATSAGGPTATAAGGLIAVPPGAGQVARASELRVVHGRISDPYMSRCRACLRAWPCPDQWWATAVLVAVSEERHGRR